MIIKTASGNITINKKSAYGKWLMGWRQGGGWTGAETLSKMWLQAEIMHRALMTGCSWFSLGCVMACMHSKK